MKNLNKTERKEIYKINQEMMNFVIKMGRFYEHYGLQRIGGQILGLLIIIDIPLTAEDIQNILQISKASISTNIKFVLNSGVEEIRYPGDRKTYYKFTDYDCTKGRKSKHSINQIFIELLEDCIGAMKRNNIKTKDLEILKSAAEFENEMIMELLIKNKKKGNKS